MNAPVQPPTWAEAVEGMAEVLSDVRNESMDDYGTELRILAANILQYNLGLTPEMLEDARALAWVERQDADVTRTETQYLQGPDNTDFEVVEPATWGVFNVYFAPTLREAVEKARGGEE